MVNIEVQTETDTARGWTFNVTVTKNNQPSVYEVSLSWSDYDHWSHGRVAPERVVVAAMAYAIEAEGLDELGTRFDCARLRRIWPAIDQELPTRL